MITNKREIVPLSENEFIESFLKGDIHPSHVKYWDNKTNNLQRYPNLPYKIRGKLVKVIESNLIYEPRIGLTKSQMKAIKTRDNNKCMECGTGNPKYNLQIHHIDCNPGNYSQRNLITMCSSCHPNANESSLWVPYLQKKAQSLPSINFPKFNENKKEIRFIKYHRTLKEEYFNILDKYTESLEEIKELKDQLLQAKIALKNSEKAHQDMFQTFLDSLEKRRNIEIECNDLRKENKRQECIIYNKNEELYQSKLKMNRLKFKLDKTEILNKNVLNKIADRIKNKLNIIFSKREHKKV